jgi:hypothetical protein
VRPAVRTSKKLASSATARHRLRRSAALTSADYGVLIPVPSEPTLDDERREIVIEYVKRAEPWEKAFTSTTGRRA